MRNLTNSLSRPFSVTTVLSTMFTAIVFVTPAAAVEPMLGGISLSYAPLIAGEINADGKDTEFENGSRYWVHFRDYYFQQQKHHPFVELGVFYETHDTRTTNFSLDTESIAVDFSFGSAIPLFWMADESMVLGISPEIGANIGSFSADINSSNGVTNQHSDDSAFRYGATAGINGWILMNQSFSLGLGLIGSYWRATGITLDVPTATGTESRSTTPSGWDVALRFTMGFLF